MAGNLSISSNLSGASRIRCGDEVVAVNGISVKGEKKNNVASLIQCSSNPVKVRFLSFLWEIFPLQITINKLEADPSKGKTMDIIVKKVKHKVSSGPVLPYPPVSR